MAPGGRVREDGEQYSVIGAGMDAAKEIRTHEGEDATNSDRPPAGTSGRALASSASPAGRASGGWLRQLDSQLAGEVKVCAGAGEHDCAPIA
jgi:hypothetical protein